MAPTLKATPLSKDWRGNMQGRDGHMATKHQYDVIVCGSLHLDIVVKAPTLPRIDETMVGSAWQKVCGGKGGNQAVQAAKAGARTAMLGRIGRDDFGNTLLGNLKAADVDTAGISIDDAMGSGMSVAILQDDGDYGAVIVSGANTTIDPENMQRQWLGLGGAPVLVLQNEVPHGVNVAAARAAQSAGAQVVFNAAPVRSGIDDLLGLVDVLVLNRIEAEALCGSPVHDRPSAIQAIATLKSSRRAVIITLGGDGLVVAPRDAGVFEVSPIAVEVTSTHGAGDCFVGVLAAALAKGADLKAACQLANEHAAAFVSRKT
jgi:ribokinase